MKHEWKKQEKEIYGTKHKTVILTIPKQKYIIIKGVGNPNGEDFSKRVGVLFSVAYPIKMNYKSNFNNKSNLFTDYVVYPLEGVWESNDKDTTNKDAYAYTIMIRQPDVITKEKFEEILELVKKKKPHPFLDEVFFDEQEDGLSAQMLHLGSYDDEVMSFLDMDEFIKEAGYKRKNDYHREIYISSRKNDPSKMKTILRYKIEKI